jgi:hypothetical protein
MCRLPGGGLRYVVGSYRGATLGGYIRDGGYTWGPGMSGARGCRGGSKGEGQEGSIGPEAWGVRWERPLEDLGGVFVKFVLLMQL